MFKDKILWYLLLIFFLSGACETGNNRIPYVRIDLHLNVISELGNPPLNSYVLIEGGVNGLIIFREDYDKFRVYDRTCTMYPDHNETVEPDENFDGVFTCPECQSKFLLLSDADPLEGPAVFGLFEYVSVLDGDLLHVYN